MKIEFNPENDTEVFAVTKMMVELNNATHPKNPYEHKIIFIRGEEIDTEELEGKL